MRQFKGPGLLAVVTAATLAFAASASATSVTTTTGGTAETPTIHLVNEGGHIGIANKIANIFCSSTIEGSVVAHGSGIPTDVNLSTVLFTGCTNSWHVTAVTNGTLSITSTGGHNGSVMSSGMRIDATRLGVTCVYDTLNTPLGILTGGNPATLKVETYIPLNSDLSSGLCSFGGPTKAQMEGSYVTTGALYVTP